VNGEMGDIEKRIASGLEMMAGVFVAATRGGRSKRRPYEENASSARWGVDGWDFEIANSDSAARFAGATDKEELR